MLRAGLRDDISARAAALGPFLTGDGVRVVARVLTTVAFFRGTVVVAAGARRTTAGVFFTEG